MKKINVGLLGLLIVFLFTINFQVSKNFKLTELSLLELKSIALADGEVDPGSDMICMTNECSLTIGYVTYYGHYSYCNCGTGTCIKSECETTCDIF